MSQMFEMRLTKEQMEWVVYMDEIQESVKQEIDFLERLALNLADYIGGVRSDYALLTGKSVPPVLPEDEIDDEFIAKVVQRMNVRGGSTAGPATS